ncbi:MAG: septum formation protein Maf [Deltaproteobacteria bacterium]|nr:septum formation protein Maf [Deltaproteobacteria bacterium]
MIVLASASPRRRELLSAAGVLFTVRPADVDEAQTPGEEPVAYALRVAASKARAVDAERVLAADTVVHLDGEVLHKPGVAEAAIATLRRLSGREHTVTTAVVLRAPVERSVVVHTRVCFRALLDDDIARYVATGEPLDRAGAYAIQGGGGALVDWIDGSYTNVVGLPLRETLAMLAR